MKQILTSLTEGKLLTRTQTHEIMLDITKEKFNDCQIAAFLTALQMRGITVDELLGLRDGLLETGLSVDLSPYQTIDIVGTGGDGKNTFNISTCSAFVIAGAGYKVSKHGNYGATSISGASNVIEEHGVKFTNNTDQLRHSLEESGVAYLHAPLFAHGMKSVAPIRKALQIPTCFNLLGPLVNPCKPAYSFLGVANLNQMRLYTNALQKLGVGFGVVCSYDGYDEISLTGEFKATTNYMEKVLKAEDLGLHTINKEELYGGTTKQEAMYIFDSVLQGTSTEAQKNVVIANSAFAIHIMEKDKTMEECVDIARESVESGKALRCLKKFIDINS
ncbi:MAG: anthranilate phosphoribosyltransferase [Bacteroides sp.]|nr:anthranilate phosphoribosyltransferase [Roseburia sp.]MCM1346833.1 anthranilate phosphoribosyltransferase [Bacteroides sp.]MCM1420641.1 anthranilate phosphoribosyltransferase [Bacteroides sp.]